MERWRPRLAPSSNTVGGETPPGQPPGRQRSAAIATMRLVPELNVTDFQLHTS
jgi:hypothetical protein